MLCNVCVYVCMWHVAAQINNAAESARFEEEALGLQGGAAGDVLYSGDSLRG
jgi:hypothetical protein